MTSAAPEIRADRSSLRRVVDALGERVRIDKGDQLYARCPVPAHGEDRKPSLSVTWTAQSRNGKPGGATYVRCHRECDYEDVLAALSLERWELFDTPPYRGGNGRAGASSPAQRRRETRVRSQPLPKAPKAGPDSPPGRRSFGRLIATHTYTDAAGVRVFDIRRFDGGDQKYACRTYTTDGRRVATNAAPTPARRVLYNLPAVRSAIAAGELVYVQEGEKDADAMTAAGVVATTNAFGAADSPDPERAASKWLPQYTEALRGAHVVLVADKDTPENGATGRGLYAGYRHVLYVAAQLEGVAASIEVVHARTGKDAHDHLAAGYLVDDLEPLQLAELRQLVDQLDQAEAIATVPAVDQVADQVAVSAADQLASASVPAPELEPSTEPADSPGVGDAQLYHLPYVDPPADDGDDVGGAGGGGGGTSGGSGDEPEWRDVLVADRFALREDGLFRLKFKPETRERLWIPLLAVPVKMAARYYVDTRTPDMVEEGDEEEAPELSYVDLLAERDGKTHTLKSLSTERWTKGTWVNDLPWLTLPNDHAGGRAQLRKAIEAVSGDVPLTPMYEALGWRLVDGRWRYVHAGGVIDSSGVVDGYRVKPPDVLRRFKLPPPPRDSAELTEAVLASVALMDAAPARVAAPMLGAAYRACLGWCRVTVMPVGAPMGGKSALGAIVAQHYFPSARHDKMPGNGAGERAGTLNWFEGIRHKAGDMLLPMDDLAPDKGTDKASERLAAIARSQYNREGRGRKRRDGREQAIERPRSLAMVTGEESCSVPSAESRIALIKVNAGDLDVMGSLKAMNDNGGPELRAKLTAAMVQHYADAMPMTDWLEKSVSALTADLIAPGLVDAERTKDARYAEIAAELAAGWRAMLEMAYTRGALGLEQASELWRWAWEGLVEFKRQLADGSARRTAADRTRELLGTLLSVRRVVLLTRDGRTPEDAERYGWEINPSGGQFGDPYRMGGEPVGWTDGVKVWFRPGAVFPHLERQAKAEGEPLQLTARGLAGALADAGVIRTTRTPTGGRRNEVQLRLAGQPQWVWEVDHDWLFPPEEEGEDDPAGEPAMPAAPKAPAAPHPTTSAATSPPGVQSDAMVHLSQCGLADAFPDAPSRPAATPAPEPTANGAEPARERPSRPDRTNTRRRPPKRSQGHTAAQSRPPDTMLSEWLAEQYPEASKADLAAAAELWHAAARGIEWRGPFETARRILRGSLRHQSIPELPPFDPATLTPVMGEDCERWTGRSWMVTGKPLELGTWLGSYDVNAMYPSAAGGELGTGDPVLIDGGRLPKAWEKMPGWVRLSADATDAPYGLGDRLLAGMWVPVPIAGYLAESKSKPKRKASVPSVDRALLWPEHRRWMAPHVTLYREAREHVAGPGLPAAMARRAVKAMGTRMFSGALRSEKYNETETLRPDWAAMIEAIGQARMFRGLDKTTARVVGIHVDAAWLVLPAADSEPPGLEISRPDPYSDPPEPGRLGKFKPIGRTQITPELVEAHRVGTWGPIYKAFKATSEEAGR